MVKRQSYYRTVIGHHMQAIEWCHFRCPWVTRDPDFKHRAGLSATAGLSCSIPQYGKNVKAAMQTVKQDETMFYFSKLPQLLNCKPLWQKITLHSIQYQHWIIKATAKLKGQNNARKITAPHQEYLECTAACCEQPAPAVIGTGPLVQRSAIPKVRCVRGYNCLHFMDRLGSGGVVGCLGFRVAVSASYRYITSFGKLMHKLRHTSFGIVDLQNSGPSD